jgi:hypothetical protein
MEELAKKIVDAKAKRQDARKESKEFQEIMEEAIRKTDTTPPKTTPTNPTPPPADPTPPIKPQKPTNPLAPQRAKVIEQAEKPAITVEKKPNILSTTKKEAKMPLSEPTTQVRKNVLSVKPKAPVNKELQPLYEEARKYKSFDEFISKKLSKEYRTVHQVDTKTASSITNISDDVID